MALQRKTNGIELIDGTDGVVNLADFVELYVIYGTPTLTGNWAITASGTPVDGDYMEFFYTANPTLGVYHVTVLGQQIPDDIAGKTLFIRALYTSSAWNVFVGQDMSGTGTIPASMVNLSGAITNTMVAASAGIEYSKLSLTGSIVNTDVNASAAIPYSKLDLTGSVIGADISTGAAIPYSKLDLSKSIATGDLAAALVVPYANLNLSDSILGTDVNASASIPFSKMEALTANKAIVTDGSGKITPSATTDAQLAYNATLTSDTQTQLDDKEPKWTHPATLPNQVMIIEKSFETGYLGIEQFRVPWEGKIARIDVEVEGTIEASDDAELIFKNNAGTAIVGSNLVAGSLTLTKGSVMNTKFTTTATANHEFDDGEYISIESRKSTAGGTVRVILTVYRYDMV